MGFDNVIGEVKGEVVCMNEMSFKDKKDDRDIHIWQYTMITGEAKESGHIIEEGKVCVINIMERKPALEISGTKVVCDVCQVYNSAKKSYDIKYKNPRIA